MHVLPRTFLTFVLNASIRAGSSFAAIAVLAVLALCIVMYISTSGSMSGALRTRPCSVTHTNASLLCEQESVEHGRMAGGGVQATMVDHKLSSILTALERSGSGPSEKFQHIEEMVQSTQKEMHEVHECNSAPSHRSVARCHKICTRFK